MFRAQSYFGSCACRRRGPSGRKRPPQHLFPTYYREETRTITVDPPPHTIEVEHITTVQVPDYEVQFVTIDRTLLAKLIGRHREASRR